MKTTRLIYVGRRTMGDGNLYQAFRQPNGELAHFKNSARRWLSIGDVCEGMVPGKDQLQISARPKELEAKPDETELIEKERANWELEDQLARKEKAKKSAARKSHDSETVKQITRLLKPFAKKFGFTEMRELIEHCADEAVREERERWSREVSSTFNARIKAANKRFKKELDAEKKKNEKPKGQK